MSEGGASFPDSCDHCGRALRKGIRYPTVTAEENDDLRIYTFCDSACKSSWMAAHRE